MPDESSNGLNALSFRLLREKEFPPEPYIISEGILPLNGLMFIAGPPKSYKSFVLQSIVLHLLTATPLFGAYRSPHGKGRTHEMAFTVSAPQRVLLLEQEVGLQDMRERILPAYNVLPPEQRRLADENLFLRSRDHTMRLDNREGCKRIHELIKQVQPTVVCFDPLIEFHGCDENDAQQMTAVLRNLDNLREIHHFATIMSHHTGKPDALNGRSGPDLLRGSSTIYGKGDTFFMLTPLNRTVGQVKIEVTVRRAKPVRAFSVLLDWQEVRAKFHQWAKGHGNKIEPIISDEASEEIEQ